MKYLQVKNWDSFQHYKDRNPPWIKLYRTLLDDINYHTLSAEAAKILPLIWILGSEKEGALPSLSELSYRIRFHIDDVSMWIEELLEAEYIIEIPVEQVATQKRHPRESCGFGNRYISKKLKEIIFIRDKGACKICSSQERLEYDHIIPTSKGGESIEANIQLLCRVCNRRKRTKISMEQVATQKKNLRSLETETYSKEAEAENNIGDFEDFWNLYGRIGNKQSANKAWKKIKGVKYGEVINGHNRYNEYCAKTSWYNKQHCASWLNARGWESEWAIQLSESKDQQRKREYEEAAIRGMLRAENPDF